MLHLLKRHPFPVAAHFDECLVLAYALPREVLEPLLSPGLELDSYEEFGFVAVAMVQTRHLRPAILPPALGRDFFLCGYRIFTRYRTSAGRQLRGLQILRSDTDRAFMVLSGNLLTHYHYHRARVEIQRGPQQLSISTRSHDGQSYLQVLADLQESSLPSGSPFPDFETARRYAGPLPYTFDYERETNSMILVKGVRKKWDPRPVRVEVGQNAFLQSPRFQGATPILANAFYLENVLYRWESGRRDSLNVSETRSPELVR